MPQSVQNQFPHRHIPLLRINCLVVSHRLFIYNGASGDAMIERHRRTSARFLEPRILILAALATLLAFAVPNGKGGGISAGKSPFYGEGSAGDTVQYVVQVSVDGLTSDAVGFLGPAHLPNFYRMRISGAFTENARTDFDYTTTLPNHTCQLTGRPVLGPDGHDVSFNFDPGTTLEYVNGHYVAGVFDVVHDSGGKTAIYASKSKFAFFERSWNGENGAPDTTGEDNGRDKVDLYVNLSETADLIDSFVTHMAAEPSNYSFIHIVDPDVAGHDSGWGSTAYYDAVVRSDCLLGRILSVVDGETRLQGKSAVLVTADHGGFSWAHSNALLPDNYTVPVYILGPGVPAGADLYQLNPMDRADPGDSRPDYEAEPQPIRNGGVSNLALALLGLEPIPGSVINGVGDLEATMPWGSADLPFVDITSPEEGEEFDSLAVIEIEASASTGSGVITRVEFYADWQKLGEDTENPFGFTWSDVMPGEYVISARAVRDDYMAAVTSVKVAVIPSEGVDGDVSPRSPLRIYPNPVGGTATVAFSQKSDGRVVVSIFDILGRRVGTLLDGYWGPGDHITCHDVSWLAPGLYIYRASIEGGVVAGKFMVVR
jgi:hypothetical protein